VISDEGSNWTRLASRVVRVLLTRNDATYASVAATLSASGTVETERALLVRVTRGTVRFSSFLQIMSAVGQAPPDLWLQPIRTAEVEKRVAATPGSTPPDARKQPQHPIDWQDRAKAIIAFELSRQALESDLLEVHRRISRFNGTTSTRTLESHLSAGTVSLPLLLQVLYVLGSDSLSQYVNFSELRSASVKSDDGTHTP
jgi:hypothetical protein